MILLTCFFIAMFFSFVGSIPPGTINITTMQYAVANRKTAALYFALAAALTEYLYAGIAVKFQIYLTENAAISANFQIISGLVLLILGVINLTRKQLPTTRPPQKENRNAFTKGVLISLANPLAIPFWLAVTFYLQRMGWVNLAGYNYLVYVAGISAGTFLLLLLVIQLGTKFSSIQHNRFVMYRLPGIIFVCMGIYTFYQ